MRRACLLLLVLASGAASATSYCPLAHFQPPDVYGSAFGDARAVTEHRIGIRAEEDLALQYLEYQSHESGYSPVFALTVLRSASGSSRAVLVREKTSRHGKRTPVMTTRDLPDGWSGRASRATARLLHATRYPETMCESISHTAGATVQVMAPARGYGLFVGEVFAPPPGSPPAAVVAFGRALRGFVEGERTRDEVEVALGHLEVAATTAPALDDPAPPHES